MPIMEENILDVVEGDPSLRISEMLVNFQQTTWCYNSEDSHLDTLQVTISATI
jgi:hypothetical protein